MTAIPYLSPQNPPACLERTRGATPDEDVGELPFALGDVLADTFELTGVLGTGGMGIVYEAVDRRLFRRVAIKAARASGPVLADGLRSEAQALAAIGSDAFVKVHAVRSHRGIDFLVMERLYGETLAARIDEMKVRRELLELPVVIDLLLAISSALAAAHGVGLAHRDLKPSNVMLCGRRVVLLDLGLVVPEVLVGPSNVPAGSIEYIAPEVLLGEVKQGQGPLVDLYALGALAFELATNAPPFHSGSKNRIMMNHIADPAPDLARVRPDVPRALATLVAELLEKEPASRPVSAESVVWQLLELRSHAQRATRIAASRSAPPSRSSAR